MYSKIFASMYDGTIVDAGWQAIVTFQQLIILSDPQGHVDMTVEAISRRTTIPADILRKGIDALQQPDPNSRSPDEEGRRIVLINQERAWGWRIVNFVAYRNMKSAEDRREYHRNYMREYMQKRREAERTQTAVKERFSELGQMKTRRRKTQDADAEAEAEADEGKTHTARSGALEQVWRDIERNYPRRAGGQRWAQARQAFNARIAEGVEPVAMLEGVMRYAAYCERNGSAGTQYVQQAATFLGTNRGYAEAWTPPPTKAETIQRRNIDAARQFLAMHTGDSA